MNKLFIAAYIILILLVTLFLTINDFGANHSKKLASVTESNISEKVITNVQE